MSALHDRPRSANRAIMTNELRKLGARRVGRDRRERCVQIETTNFCKRQAANEAFSVVHGLQPGLLQLDQGDRLRQAHLCQIVLAELHVTLAEIQKGTRSESLVLTACGPANGAKA